MASFQAKTGRDMLRMIQKKKKKVIVSIHSNLAQNKEFQNDRKEMQKIKKHHYGFISGQNGTRHTGNDENDMGQDENDTKKMLWF